MAIDAKGPELARDKRTPSLVTLTIVRRFATTIVLYMTRCAKVLACHCTNTSLPVSSDNKEKLIAEKRPNDLCIDAPVMT
jgi:hypothetical protein